MTVLLAHARILAIRPYHTMDKAQITALLSGIKLPYSTQDIVSAKALCAIDATGEIPHIKLSLGYPALSKHTALTDQIIAALGTAVTIDIDMDVASHIVQKGITPLPEVKNTIAIASGKGGVGKSTTAVNLALALQAEGARVGILDADIYGPSQPRMLGANGHPETSDGKHVQPKVSYRLQSMSMGYLIGDDTPMIWRGPMVTAALEQLLMETKWDGLDYLVIDMPPGTGDIHLTLCQKIPVTGAIIITTPQDIALLDAKKSLNMFTKVGVPVLGVIENMATHICRQCGHEEAIFGSGGGEQMAAQYEVELLGSLPLDSEIRIGSDNGKPIVAMAPESVVADKYRDIASRAAAKIAMQGKDYSARFPKIVVENN